MNQVREIVASKILVGGAGQKVVWERLLGKKGGKQVSNNNGNRWVEWTKSGFQERSTEKRQPENGRSEEGLVAHPFSSLYIWKKTIFFIQIKSHQVSSRDKIGVSKAALPWALPLLLSESHPYLSLCHNPVT